MKIIAKIDNWNEASIVINDPVEYQIPTWKGSAKPPDHFHQKMSASEFIIMMENFASENGIIAQITKTGELSLLEE